MLNSPQLRSLGFGPDLQFYQRSCYEDPCHPLRKTLLCRLVSTSAQAIRPKKSFFSFPFRNVDFLAKSGMAPFPLGFLKLELCQKAHATTAAATAATATHDELWSAQTLPSPTHPGVTYPDRGNPSLRLPMLTLGLFPQPGMPWGSYHREERSVRVV